MCISVHWNHHLFSYQKCIKWFIFHCQSIYSSAGFVFGWPCQPLSCMVYNSCTPCGDHANLCLAWCMPCVRHAVTMPTFVLHGVSLVYTRRWPCQPLSCMVYASCTPCGDHANLCLAWCMPRVRLVVTMPTFVLHGVRIVYARRWPCQPLSCMVYTSCTPCGDHANLCLAWCMPCVRQAVTMPTFVLHGVSLVYTRRWPCQPLSCMVYASCTPGGGHANLCLAWCMPRVRLAVTMPTFVLHGVRIVYARRWPCQPCLAWCTHRVRQPVTMPTFVLHGVSLVYARRWPCQPLSCMVYTSCTPGGDHANLCLAWCMPRVRQAVTMPIFVLHGVCLVYARRTTNV